MSNSANFDLELESLKEAATDKWFMQQSLDFAAFQRLYAYLANKSEVLKAEYVVSKQIIRVMLDASNALESANEKKLAGEFMMLLGLISRNEAANDRKPGVPRIV
ncbi:hypothetical protein [Rheinheimera sp. EpRS3]|uniref:hypothetical protein n=1 Tax=Rheinheimera sp. EpRS3 TaxID=1712383 RepID=UPI0007467201|nr:hypothetical protein [Rheinheimera sp. EpRS3]KUM53571.1 hypothetical protein AR688_06605 [Rheinheimera sp. EpRS3]